MRASSTSPHSSVHWRLVAHGALLAIAAVGCSSSATAPPGGFSASPVDAPISAAPPSSAQAREEVREGPLGVTKGNPTVGGALLPHDIVKRVLGDDWQRVALGKRVRARGTLRIHRCGPEEQCLMSGEIPIFEATSIELVEPTSPPP